MIRPPRPERTSCGWGDAMDRPCPGRIWGRGGKLLEFLSSFGVVVGDELLFDDFVSSSLLIILLYLFFVVLLCCDELLLLLFFCFLLLLQFRCIIFSMIL